MISSDDGFYAKDKRRLIILAVLLGVVAVGFFVYKSLYFEFADARYTVAEVTGEYHNSKVIGIKFSYYVSGIKIEGNCIDQNCHNLSTGTRFIVKYFVNKPNWNSLFTDLEVPANISAPIEGWKEVPRFDR